MTFHSTPEIDGALHKISLPSAGEIYKEIPKKTNNSVRNVTFKRFSWYLQEGHSSACQDSRQGLPAANHNHFFYLN